MSAALFPELVVNGELVPHAVVAAETQNQSAPRGKPGIAWRKAADAVAVRTLLLQEARRQGLQPEPAEVGPGRVETEDEALIRALLEAEVEIDTPTEEDVHGCWAQDPSRFRAPPLWEVTHILCACDPRNEEARADTQKRADELARLILREPRKFAEIAHQHSDCGSKSSGGALGQLGPGDTVPEFEAALRSMEEGEITTSPVLTRFGWHIIRLDAAAEGDVLPYEAVRKKISEAMEKAAWAQEARDFVHRLVSAAEIVGADLRSF